MKKRKRKGKAERITKDQDLWICTLRICAYENLVYVKMRWTNAKRKKKISDKKNSIQRVKKKYVC